jgi:hypothetical protein
VRSARAGSRETGTTNWVLLAFRVPRVPSTPRIAIWRKLKRLGVVQVLDGLVALPLDARTREQLEWVAEEVVEHGGTATLWTGRPTGIASEKKLMEAMAVAIAAEYQAVVDDVAAAVGSEHGEQQRTLSRLRRELHRIAQRDYFPPVEGEIARRALRDLSRLVEERALTVVTTP